MRLLKNGIGAIGLMKVSPLVENSVCRNKLKISLCCGLIFRG